MAQSISSLATPTEDTFVKDTLGESDSSSDNGVGGVSVHSDDNPDYASEPNVHPFSDGELEEVQKPAGASSTCHSKHRPVQGKHMTLRGDVRNSSH